MTSPTFASMRLLPTLVFAIALVSCVSDPSTDGNRSDSVTRTDGTLRNGDSVIGIHNDSAVEKVDCSILRKRVADEKNQTQIKNDLNLLCACAIDSFDFLYVVPNLFPAWLSEKRVQGNDSVTYGDFVAHLKEFQKTDSYYKLHVQVETLDSLRTVAFDSKKIYTMKPVLGRLGFTEQEWNMFSGFAATYPVPKQKKVFTWGDMLDAFDKYNPSPNGQ
jgi:hypothetical protein